MASGCSHTDRFPDEMFGGMLPLPIIDQRRFPVRSVQDAWDAFLAPEEAPASYVWSCQRCGSDRPLLCRSLVRAPPVLAVVLKRWSNIGAEGALLHYISANQKLGCGTHAYDLCSVVVHLGEAPSSGHYVAVVKHAAGDCNWWLYDDLLDEVRRADWYEILTMSEYNGQPMQSYFRIA